MEKSTASELRSLINELSQGRDLVNQLQAHLDASSAHRTRQFLVGKILSSYDKALTMLQLSNFTGELRPINSVVEPPAVLSGSCSRSEGSDRDCKDQFQKDCFKKRKTLPRWTDQVRVCVGTGLEGPLDDGYSWRKYGQKDILGANFPRGYYRCTYRNVQGCLATKQVQKSDEDPSIFEIMYRGRHTCTQASHLTSVSSALEKEGLKQSNDQYQQQQKQQVKQKPSRERHLNVGAGLKKPEYLDTRDQIFSSISFLPTLVELDTVEDSVFSQSISENNLMGSFPPAFISPSTSESDYFSLSPCQMNSFGIGNNLQTSEPDLTEILSAPTSVTNSPIGNLDISLDPVEFDPNFPFDDTDFFS